MFSRNTIIIVTAFATRQCVAWASASLNNIPEKKKKSRKQGKPSAGERSLTPFCTCFRYEPLSTPFLLPLFLPSHYVFLLPGISIKNFLPSGQTIEEIGTESDGRSSIPGMITSSFFPKFHFFSYSFFFWSTYVDTTKYYSDLIICFRRLRAITYDKYRNE